MNTLNVLKDACANPFFAHEIFRLGGIECIIQSITFDHIGIEESCQILLKILSFHRARRVIRRSGGIGRLVTILLGIHLSSSFSSLDLFTRSIN